MNEIWKDIEGYEGYYQVSNLGRVRSLDRVVTRVAHVGFPPIQQLCKGRILKATLDSKRYPFVDLCIEQVRNQCRVHRLVARAFVPGYFEGAVVNHKDENRQNNRADNLEWCTQQYNVTYNDANYRARENRRKRVIQLSLDGKFIAEYESAHEAARKTGFSAGNISNVCRGIRISSNGFKWKYKE